MLSMETMPVTPIPAVPPTLVVPASPKKSHLIPLIFLVIILLGAMGAAYAYAKKIGPFSQPPYDEGNLFTGLTDKLTEVHSLTYALSGSLNVTVRETGAKPFTIEYNDTQQLEKYKNDAQRAKDATDILSALAQSKSPYPTSLDKLSTSRRKINFEDPVSHQPYQYQVTDWGKNFSLKVTFDLPQSILTIRRAAERYGYYEDNGYEDRRLVVSGQQITFTKDSYSYFYLPSEPGKPLLAQLTESASRIPPDISGSVAISATADWGQSSPSSWRFNFAADGDTGGDLTYKVGAEALKKGSDYYFRLNNFPSVFFFDLSAVKGQWIKVSANDLSSIGGRDELSDLVSELPEIEEKFKSAREKSVHLIKKVVALADSERLFVLKNPPYKDKVDNQSLYRYDLKIRKDALLPFYKKLVAEIDKDPELADYRQSGFDDQGLIEYLNSSEFSKVFDYYDQNTAVSLWVDGQGFPVASEYRIRLVPPDTAIQLKDKQVNLLFKTTLSDINQPVIVEVPASAKPVSEILEALGFNTARDKQAAASTKAHLSSIRAQAELVYEEKGGYGTKPFTLGPCSNKAQTLFADESIYDSLQRAGGGDATKVTCVSTVNNLGKVGAFAVSAPLPDADDQSWCVDSDGYSKQITGSIVGSSCGPN